MIKFIQLFYVKSVHKFRMYMSWVLLLSLKELFAVFYSQNGEEGGEFGLEPKMNSNKGPLEHRLIPWVGNVLKTLKFDVGACARGPVKSPTVVEKV